MFMKSDTEPQLDLFTAPSMQLGKRTSKKYTYPKAWHNQFFKLVTSKIAEETFAPLFKKATWVHPMHQYVFL